MSEAWERWRVALVPLGIATALIGAVWAFTAGGPSSGKTSATVTHVSAERPRSSPPTPPPTTPQAPVAPSTMASASASAAPEDAGPPPTAAMRLTSKREAAVKLKETYQSRIAPAKADAVDLDRTGKAAEASKKRDEAANLQKLVDQANRDIADLDTLLDGGVVPTP